MSDDRANEAVRIERAITDGERAVVTLLLLERIDALGRKIEEMSLNQGTMISVTNRNSRSAGEAADAATALMTALKPLIDVAERIFVAPEAPAAEPAPKTRARTIADAENLEARRKAFLEYAEKAPGSVSQADFDVGYEAGKQARYVEPLLNLDEFLAQLPYEPTHRHLKTGRRYQVLGDVFDASTNDNAIVTIYVGSNGQAYARSRYDFDVKFEPLLTPDASS